jgi:hypothetical protein
MGVDIKQMQNIRMQKIELKMQKMTSGEHLAHSLSFALSKARKVVRGLPFGLTREGAMGGRLQDCRAPQGAWRQVEAERGV